MKTPKLALCLSLSALLLAWACGDGGSNNTTCSPACGAGKTCKDGKCVASSTGKDGGGGSGDVDAGDDIIITKPDAGTVVNKPDTGTETCAADTTKAEQLPLDIYIMFDQSGSMAGDKWTSTTSAIESFVSQPLTNVSVGIQYFGLPAGGSSTCSVYDCYDDVDCGAGCGPCDYYYYYGGTCAGYVGSGSDSCVAADYATPDVEIAPLPGVAAAIKTSLAAHSPDTLTPTSAALQGAVDHAKAWGTAHPGHAVITILATDGEPNGCDESIANIAGIAQAGVNGTPKVLTFVIGVGSSLDNLNDIAAGGGSTAAFMVDTGGNVQQQFLDALNKIRGAALGCNYTIPTPASGTPDYTKVNVQYTPGGTTTKTIFPMVQSKAACPASGDAWYYDNPSAPTQIILCPASCTKVQADSTGAMDVLLGCQTIIN